MEQRCFNDLSVSIYRLLYKEFLLTMIKIRQPNIQQPLSREQGISNGHKVRRQSISQERGSWLSGFVVRRMFTERNPRMRFHPMTSVLGVVCCSTRSHYQELIRNRGFMRDRKQHTGILLLNVPWQCWGKSKLMGECYPSWHLKVFNSSFDHVGYNESAFWTCFKTGRIWTLSSW